MNEFAFRRKLQEIKESLSETDIIDFVCQGLGSQSSKEDASGNLVFQTIDHNPPGEGSYKLYYYLDRKIFISYTGDGQPMDIFELTKRAKGYETFREAYSYVCSFFHLDHDKRAQGFTTAEEETERINDWELLYKISDLNNRTEEGVPQLVPENLLTLYKRYYPSEWLREGILPETMDKYNISVDIAGSKIIIPHYNIDGELVGIRSRNYDPGELERGMKYCPVWIGQECYRHELGKHLYGLHRNKEAIQRTGRACIVEAEKSVMLAEGFYPDNNYTVATCGSAGLSTAQIKLLLGLGCKEIVLAYDKENDNNPDSPMTKEYIEKLTRIAQPLTSFFDVYVVFDCKGLLGPKDSPFDKGKDVLEQLLEEKQYLRSLVPKDFEQKVR